VTCNRYIVGGFPQTLVSSTNKTDCHDITEILLKVALNTITLTQNAYLPSKTSNSKYVDFLKFHFFFNFTDIDGPYIFADRESPLLASSTVKLTCLVYTDCTKYDKE
jgi:hypothetical protein